MEPLEAVLGEDDHAVSSLDARFDERRRDRQDVAAHPVPAFDLPVVAHPVVDQRAVAIPRRLAEEDADRGPVGNGLRIDDLARGLVGPQSGRGST